DGDELAHAFLGFDLAVERVEGGFPLLFAMFVEPLGVLRLDVRGVGEHDLTEVARGEGGVDVAVEAPTGEGGEGPAVVDVGVGEDHRIEARGIEGKGAVAFVRLVSASLVKPAVEKNSRAVDVDEVLGTGGRLGGAAESDVHGKEW